MKKILTIVVDLLIIFLFVITNYKVEYDAKEIIKLDNIKKISNNVNKLEIYKKQYNNDDIIGSIKIDGTKIDSLIVKGSDNKYYLNHSIDKKYNKIGTIFVDYRTNLSSKQINIYGHNSLYYDLQFKDLEKYLDKNFYNEHKYIKIWDGINTNIYEIFSVQITNNSEHMIVDSVNLKEHINKLSKSIYETNVNVSELDNLLVLQTCYLKEKNTYIIICSKKVNSTI